MYRTSAKEIQMNKPVRRPFREWADDVNLVERSIALFVANFLLGIVLICIAAFIENLGHQTTADAFGNTGFAFWGLSLVGLLGMLVVFFHKCYRVIIGEETL